MLEEACGLPRGYMLYRERNEVGGWRYWSDEIGGGVVVLDTSLNSLDTVLIAIGHAAANP